MVGWFPLDGNDNMFILQFVRTILSPQKHRANQRRRGACQGVMQQVRECSQCPLISNKAGTRPLLRRQKSKLLSL